MSSIYDDHTLPLDPGSRWIRVFDLEPTRFGNGDEAVRGQLRVVCLDHDPSFVALSYAWGSHLNLCRVACGTERTLAVTVNCYSALQQLRHSFRAQTLWVDSLCINQSNDQEKSHQVSLMQDIYGKAKKVCIWLGNGNDHSDCAIDWLANATADLSLMTAARIAPFPEFLRPRDLSRVLRMILECAILGKFLKPLLKKHMTDYIRVAVYPKRPKELEAGYNAEAMEDLINRDWFKRVWTIQELVLAREPIVVCGRKSIRWSNLQWGIQSAKRLVGEEDNDLFSELFNSVFVAQAFWMDHQLITEWGEAPNRRWLLREESPTFLKDFFDFMGCHGNEIWIAHILFILLAILIRIYQGLRPLNTLWLLLPIISGIATIVLTPAGIYSDHDMAVRKRLANMLNKTRVRKASKDEDRVFALYGVLQTLGIPLRKPDYEKSVGQIYCEFAREVISWCKSLDILIESSTPNLPDNPTWVPDWTTRCDHIVIGGSCAAKHSSPHYSFSDCGRILDTLGVVADTVVYCSQMLEEPGDELFSRSQAPLDIAFLTRSLHNIKVLTEWISYALQVPNQSPETFTEALFGTLHSETDFNTINKSNLRQIFNKWYAVLTADYSEFGTICSPDIACALALCMNTSLNRYHRERSRAIAGKRIFFITLNVYIGTGPPYMRTSDKVAVLSGLSVPLILRERGQTHEVIGATYIHAIMGGEAWPKDEANLRQIALI